MLKAKTYSAKPREVKREWHVVDAAKAPLGRVATQAASLLIGKHKPSFTKHIDNGDGVVIINAAKVVLTGKKAEQKQYYSHSGYPGSLKTTTFKQAMSKDPKFVVTNAVRGMLPKNKLQGNRLKRLKVYPGEEHNQFAQKPTEHKPDKPKKEESK